MKGGEKRGPRNGEKLKLVKKNILKAVKKRKGRKIDKLKVVHTELWLNG